MNRFISVGPIVLGVVAFSVIASSAISTKLKAVKAKSEVVETASVPSAPPFTALSWTVEFSDEDPRFEVVNGVLHTTYDRGARLILVRESGAALDTHN